MPNARAKAGFTLIELIVVMAIMGILLALSAPFVSAARSDIAMNRTVRMLRTDLITNLGYSMAGKSMAALSADALLDPEKIPGYYGLYFQSTDDYGDLPPYQYLEFHPDEDGQTADVSYLFEKEWASPEVYLKEIRLSRDDGSQPVTVDSVLVLFSAPFGRIHFVTGLPPFTETSRLNLDDTFLSGRDYRKIEFVFQYKDEPLTETAVTLSTDNIINID